MIRAVFDTNVIISGRLWSGAPRQALTLAYSGKVKLLISEGMLDELKDVINRPKFAERLALVAQTPEEFVSSHLLFTEIIEVMPLPATIQKDPDDDAVLACALAGRAEYVVTGDSHLLGLGVFENTAIVTAKQFLEKLLQEDD